MFIGIIEAVGSVREVELVSSGARVIIDAGVLVLADVKIGDSIAVDGVCLIVVALVVLWLVFEVLQETLNCMIGFVLYVRVNLE